MLNLTLAISILMRQKGILCLFAITICTTVELKADIISLIRADQCETITEIYIEEDQIRVTFEIGENDYIHFHRLIPEEYMENGLNDQNKSEYLSHFFNETFIITANGKRLTGELIELKRLPRNYRASLYTGQVDTASLTISPRVIYAEIIYITEKPNHVAITPPLIDGYSGTLANIGFVTYHKGLPVNDLRYLATEETVHLDWSDPWYTKFENKNIARHHKNSLMSFLYVDPYEIRHEMLVRLKDLEDWIDLDYHIDDDIKAAELDSIKNVVADFLITRNKLTADGIAIPPILDKVHFVEVKLSGIQILEKPRDLPYSAAIIGVILVYPHESMPGRVTIDWDMWSEKLQSVPCVMSDPAGPMPYDLMPGDTTLVWVNYLKNYELPTVSKVNITQASVSYPLFTILLLLGLTWLVVHTLRRRKSWNWIRITGAIVLLIGAFLLLPFWVNTKIPFVQKKSFSRPEASTLVADLLHNTYRSFDFRDESLVYDKLALCNYGDLLSEIYIQTKQSMVLENQGGIQVKLKSVDMLNVDEIRLKDLEKDALAFECEWVVEGDVGHWGHIHKRINQYQAIMKVKPVEGSWKMYGLEIIEETRKL